MNIKSIRISLNLSQAKFADKFGIPVNTLAQWEQGKRKPPEYIPKMIYTIIQMERMLQQHFPNYDSANLINRKELESEILKGVGECRIRVFDPSVNYILQIIRKLPATEVFLKNNDEDFQALDDQEGIK